MQELEREKDTLQLQVTVLEDQIESQSRRIQEIGEHCLSNSVADPDLGSGAFFTPGYRMGKKSGSGSGMNIPDHISESLETFKYLNSLMRIRDGEKKILKFFDANPGWKKFISGIWDEKKSDPGTGLNIPDPQY
jgi:hypothetical protein